MKSRSGNTTSENLISIIVPVYRCRDYLSQCLESVAGQTHHELEIILVDDGSPDDCGALCEEFASRDSRVRVYHKENGGLSSARNYGIDRAHGDWIGFVDSDDWVEPEMFSCLLNAACAHNARIAACGYWVEYTTGHVDGPTAKSKMVLSTPNELADGFFGGRFIGRMTWNKLYGRDVFDAGFRFPEGRNFEDGALVCAILRGGWTLICVEDRLYHYRQRKNSIVHKENVKNSLDKWLSAAEQLEAIRELRFQPETVAVEEGLEAVVSLWRGLLTVGKDGRQRLTAQMEEMRDFVKHNAFTTSRAARPLSMRLTHRACTPTRGLSYIVPGLISLASAWKKRLGRLRRSAASEYHTNLFE